MDRQKKGPGIRRSMSFSHGNLNKHVRNISKLRRNINFDRINISCGLIINYYSRSVWSIISLPTKNTTAATTRGDEDQVMKKYFNNNNLDCQYFISLQVYGQQRQTVTRAQAGVEKSVLSEETEGKRLWKTRSAYQECCYFLLWNCSNDYNPYLFELIKEILPLMPK